MSAGSTIYSTKQAGKAAKSNQQAATLDRQRMNLQSARERRDAIRQARLSQAQAVMAGENQGVSGSSGIAGGVGSIQSQLNSNLSFLDRHNVLSDMASEQIGYANKFNQKAKTGEAVGNLANTVFNQSSTLSQMWKTNSNG